MPLACTVFHSARVISSRVQADFQTDGFRTLVQAVQVLLKESKNALVEADAFPYAVSNQKAAVEYRNFGFAARYQIAVDIDQNSFVARILKGIVGSVGHIAPLSA